MTQYQRPGPFRTKRAIDILGSMASLAVASPVLGIVALAIKAEDGGPILFRQERAGLHGQPFTILKFRSMIADADSYLDDQGRPTRDRVTRVGKVIRKLSIDELPQFLNVLKGDMSIIGPRPVPLGHRDLMTERQRGRFRVQPGITGLAQVVGRHSLTWTERIEFDLAYVSDCSWRTDAKVLLLTPKALLGADARTDRLAENLDLGDR